MPASHHLRLQRGQKRAGQGKGFLRQIDSNYMPFQMNENFAKTLRMYNPCLCAFSYICHSCTLWKFNLPALESVESMDQIWAVQMHSGLNDALPIDPNLPRQVLLEKLLELALKDLGAVKVSNGGGKVHSRGVASILVVRWCSLGSNRDIFRWFLLIFRSFSLGRALRVAVWCCIRWFGLSFFCLFFVHSRWELVFPISSWYFFFFDVFSKYHLHK